MREESLKITKKTAMWRNFQTDSKWIEWIQSQTCQIIWIILLDLFQITDFLTENSFHFLLE